MILFIFLMRVLPAAMMLIFSFIATINVDKFVVSYAYDLFYLFGGVATIYHFFQFAHESKEAFAGYVIVKKQQKEVANAISN
jgi:hypothetical protein